VSTLDDINALLAAHGTPEVELEEWELPWFDAKVALEDGRRFLVHGDQRDQRQAMAAMGGSAAAQRDELGFSQAVAWAYLTRVGRLEGMDWPAFSAAVAFVQMRQTAAVDPTQRAGEP
jgi:hypothetical protein